MSQYLLSVAAQEDIDEVIEYLLENTSTEVANRINDSLETALNKIALNPEIGHLRKDLSDSSLRFWLVDSYLILYLAESSPIGVIRVIHSKRDVAALIRDF